MRRARQGRWFGLAAGGAVWAAAYAAAMVPTAGAASLWIEDGGYERQFEVARDELCVVAPDGRREFRKVAAARSGEDQRRRAARLAETTGGEVELVLYECDVERNPYTRRVLTKKVLVRAESGAAEAAAANAAGGTWRAVGDYAPGYFLLETPETGGALDLAARLRGQPGIASAEPLLASQPAKRWIPNDPLFPNQWHLANTGQGGGTAGIDVQVTNVWDTYRGANILIGIVDDGLQLTHTDLYQSVNTNLDWDWNGNDGDPSPNLAYDPHGTTCAGVAAARGHNGRGVSGAAPEATLVGYRLISSAPTDEMEASALTTNNHAVHIKSNSWGPDDDGKTVKGPGVLTTLALSNAAATGRGGLGTLIVWAGGNGGAASDNANNDGYVNSPYTLAIAAVTENGTQPWYGEPGACLIAAAPGGGGEVDILTTDLMGNDGDNYAGAGSELSDVNYTQLFKGTSASAPLMAGVLALVLQANPNLGWRDVQEILMCSATQNAATDSDWRTNAAGFTFNHKFGAGLVNARAAVALATNWVNLGPRGTATAVKTNLSLVIPDNTAAGITQLFSFAATPLRAEHVTVTLDIQHRRRGQLAVTLTAPSGMQSRLAENRTVDTNANYAGWTFSSVRHWGELAQGTWALKVADQTSGTIGTMRWARVDIYGTDPATALTNLTARSEKPFVSMQVATHPGLNYALQATTNLMAVPPVWRGVVTQAGTGGLVLLQDANTANSQKYYRVVKP